jgi:hypothetical protein
MEIVSTDLYQVALYICYGGKVKNFKGMGTTKSGYAKKYFYVEISPFRKWLADNIGIVHYTTFKWARQYAKKLDRKQIPNRLC